MIRITIDGKLVLFRCNKKRPECGKASCRISDNLCQHTTDLENATWDGEKAFYTVTGNELIEF